MKSNKIPLTIYLILSVVVFAFNGCGGGGGGGGGAVAPTVSGVAASGSPLIGQVSMIDAKGTVATGSPMTLNSDGSFAFNVSGLTPPFILKAVGTVGGTSVTMFSVAMGPGTANINPMSSIAVAAAAGVNDPGLVFANPATNAPNITTATLNKAITDMQTMLAPLLTAFNATGMNPVTGSYTANHTGLDALFDVVQMPINTGTGSMSVFDKTAGASGATIGAALMSQMATPTQPITQTPSTAVPTDLQDIGTMLTNFGGALNKGTNLTPTDLEPFFIPDTQNFGINGGLPRAQLISVIQAITPTILAQGAITQMANVTFIGNAPGGGYRIMFAVRFSDGSLTMSNMTGFSDEMVVAKNTGTNAWQFKGNGHHSLIFNNMQTQQWQTATTTRTEAGFNFDMLDLGNVFKAAVATGPGLPSVPLVKETTNPLIFMLKTPTAGIPTMATEFFTMPDATISSIPDNAAITFAFYSSLPTRNNPMELRTMTFPKRCFTRAEAAATSGLFPAVTPTGNLATHSFSTMMGNMMGGMMGSGMLSMSFTYATPTALPIAMMSADFNISSNTFSNETVQILPLNMASMTMQMAGPTNTPPTAGTGALNITATDLFGRNVGTAWMFQ